MREHRGGQLRPLAPPQQGAGRDPCAGQHALCRRRRSSSSVPECAHRALMCRQRRQHRGWLTAVTDAAGVVRAWCLDAPKPAHVAALRQEHGSIAVLDCPICAGFSGRHHYSRRRRPNAMTWAPRCALQGAGALRPPAPPSRSCRVGAGGVLSVDARCAGSAVYQGSQGEQPDHRKLPGIGSTRGIPHRQL